MSGAPFGGGPAPAGRGIAPLRPPRAPSVAASVLPLLLAAVVAAAPWHGAGAHGPAPHGAARAPAKAEQQAWGIAGDPKRVTRTIEIRMDDRMRFVPDRIEVREGETVRLSIRNDGKVMHELVLGTKAELDEHAALMARFPNMEHDEPWMAHVAPGERGEIVWRFNRVGEFDFACLIAGHYQAGMVGKLVVRPSR
jgi:uncharacterized cupredoxin-like copper-binding protein